MLKVLVERMPHDTWIKIDALERALARDDIRSWLVSAKTISARNGYGIATRCIGRGAGAANRAVAIVGPARGIEAAHLLPEAHEIEDPELLSAALTLDNKKRKRLQRWLQRNPMAGAARPPLHAGAKAARLSSSSVGAAAAPSSTGGGGPSGVSPFEAPSTGRERKRQSKVTMMKFEDDMVTMPVDDLNAELQLALDDAGRAHDELERTREALAEARAERDVARAENTQLAERARVAERLEARFRAAALLARREANRRVRLARRGAAAAKLCARVASERDANELAKLAARVKTLDLVRESLVEYKEHAETFIGPKARSPTGAHCWGLVAGKLEPHGARQQRLARLAK